MARSSFKNTVVPVPKVLLITPPWPYSKLAKVLQPVFEIDFEEGSLALMLRDKAADGVEFFYKASRLRDLTSKFDVSFLINQRVDVARSVSADGVHLPEKGLLPSDVREVMGENALLGVSCHDDQGLQNAEKNQSLVNYAFLGPIFHVPAKNTPLGINQFKKYVQNCKLPVLALGGVDQTSTKELLVNGAAGVAVIRSVFEDTHPDATVKEMLRQCQIAVNAGSKGAQGQHFSSR